MCLTLPARILSLGNNRALVESNGKELSVMIGISDRLSAGDFVLTTGDYLIKKIDQIEAEEIIELLKSYPAAQRDSMNPDLRNVLDRAAADELTKKDLEYLLSLTDKKDLAALYSEANIVRKTNIKDHICVHGIIEFSNYCKNDCYYCGLRKSNTEKKNYRLTPEEIIDAAVQAVNSKGYKILVLQSGEDDYFSEARLAEIISSIKKQAKCFIYISIGERPINEYETFKKAGANGILYRFETSNPKLYAQLRPDKILADRINQIRQLKVLGYIISTGMIVGLPGQKMSDLAEDIILMKELGTFMPSMGPLVPTKNTPLQSEGTIDFELMLKVIAVTRLYLKTARIPVTTAMETLGGGDEARKKCFMAGANSIMFNLTPSLYRENYRIYDNKYYDAEKRYEKWALFKGELSYRMIEDELQIKL
ncbi:MAG: [FeFe] hydrogenase H-cluster radical SAM maturase HydE [Candidatus Buchananbacteria bacterium]|jgi:biotin synthase